MTAQVIYFFETIEINPHHGDRPVVHLRAFKLVIEVLAEMGTIGHAREGVIQRHALQPLDSLGRCALINEITSNATSNDHQTNASDSNRDCSECRVVAGIPDA